MSMSAAPMSCVRLRLIVACGCDAVTPTVRPTSWRLFWCSGGSFGRGGGGARGGSVATGTIGNGTACGSPYDEYSGGHCKPACFA